MHVCSPSWKRSFFLGCSCVFRRIGEIVIFIHYHTRKPYLITMWLLRVHYLPYMAMLLNLDLNEKMSTFTKVRTKWKIKSTQNRISITQPTVGALSCSLRQATMSVVLHSGKLIITTWRWCCLSTVWHSDAVVALPHYFMQCGIFVVFPFLVEI